MSFPTQGATHVLPKEKAYQRASKRFLRHYHSTAAKHRYNLARPRRLLSKLDKGYKDMKDE